MQFSHFGRSAAMASILAVGSLADGFAAEDPTAYFAQAIGRVASSVRQAGDRTDVGYNEGLSLFGGLIRSNDSTALSQEFPAGNTYIIAGGGDDDASDVDLEVVDPFGNLIARDTDADSTPVVRFTTRAAGFYRIRMKLAGCRTDASFCAMAILRKGGWDVPADNMIKACTKALGARSQLANLGMKLNFSSVRNQWSFFGGIVPKGDHVELRKMNLGSGYHVLLAAGDDHARDLDAFLSDNGGVVNADEKDDASPIVEANAIPGRDYSIRVRTVDANGPPLVVAIVLSK